MAIATVKKMIGTAIDSSMTPDVIPLMNKRQFSLKSGLLAIALAAIVIAVYTAYSKPQIDKLPPQHILKRLENRFDDLTPNTSVEQIFRELGLGQYAKRLRKDSLSIGGAGFGGSQSEYLRGHCGYWLSITFFDEGDHLICSLRTPDSTNWLERKLSTKTIASGSEQ